MLLSTESQHQEDKWRNEQEAPSTRESRDAQLAPDSFYWNMYKTFNFKKTKYYLWKSLRDDMLQDTITK